MRNRIVEFRAYKGTAYPFLPAPTFKNSFNGDMTVGEGSWKRYIRISDYILERLEREPVIEAEVVEEIPYFQYSGSEATSIICRFNDGKYAALDLDSIEETDGVCIIERQTEFFSEGLFEV